MTDDSYLQRIFTAYYKENREQIPAVRLLEYREFGLFLWESDAMVRPLAFKNMEDLKSYLILKGPKHVYSSGSLYDRPDHPEMDRKGYKGCDLIIDIDVDHFYTPCKEDHDSWSCKECGKKGKGMKSKCPQCGSLRLDKLAWVCEKCLDVAKEEIKKLIFDFFVPDFGMDVEDMEVTFSGHRGYHLKVEDPNVRVLDTEARREIVDFVTGENLSLEVLGLQERGSNIYGLLPGNIGWSAKILTKMEEILSSWPDGDIEGFLRDLGLTKNPIGSLLSSRHDLLRTIKDENSSLWSLEGFGLTNWKTLLGGIVHEIGAEIDEPVTIDIHRLIRYPGSLHGKTGFRVQRIPLGQIDEFNPLDAPRKEIDPIVFFGEVSQHIEITAHEVPKTRIKGGSYGPYSQGQVLEVPNHVAVFLLCKGVATIN